MKRILFFAPYFHPYLSGITSYPLHVLSNLAGEHQVTVLTFKHQSDLPSESELNGMQIVRMPFAFKLSKGFISFSSLKYFWQHARSADAVILNLPNAEGLPLAILARLMGKQILAFFHCQLSFENGLWQKLVGGLANTSVYLQLWLANQAIGYTKDYLDSTLAGRLFSKKFKFALPPVKNFSQQKLSDELQTHKQPDEIWIGFAGRVSREKGLLNLAKAIASSQDKNKIKLVIAGPYGEQVAGEEDTYFQLKSALDQLGIKHIFMGKLDGEQLGEFYASLDLLCLPSTNSTEAFGMVQAEAMLLGVPVIAGNLPGVRVPVQLTGMGELVKPADVGDLQQKIELVLGNRAKYLKKENLLKAQEKFSADNTVQLVKKILGVSAQEEAIKK